MPVKDTVCGLPPPVSVMLTTALRDPVLVGLNEALIVQLFPAPIDEPQLLNPLKSPRFCPVILMLLMFRAVLPVLVKVTSCAALFVPTFWGGKVSCVGERLTTVPAPISSITCGLVEALSEIETSPDFSPCVSG